MQILRKVHNILTGAGKRSLVTQLEETRKAIDSFNGSNLDGIVIDEILKTDYKFYLGLREVI